MRISLILFLQLAIFAIYGQTFYVSNNGSDANPGTLQLPWKTISYAVSSSKVVPGSTVYIRAGVYYERVVLSRSGASTGYITFTAYPNEVPILDATGLAVNTKPLFDIADNSFIKIIGLSFRNAGIGVSGGNDHIDIEYNQFNNFTNPAIRVLDCSFSEIHNNIVDAACTTSWGECITFSGCEYIDVYNNTVRNGTTNKNGGEGIDVKGSKFIRVFGNKVYNLPAKLGIYIDSFESLNSYIQVFNNEVYNCVNGIVISSERGNDMLNIRVFNNIVHDLISGNGVSVVDYFSTAYLAQNIIIENNTLVGTGISIDASNGNNIVVRNNIIHDDSSPIKIVNRSSGLVLQNNLGNKATLSELGTNSIVADPLFVNSALKNYNLQASSPAINSGFQNNLAFDYNSKQRNIGVNDIGACEYNAVTNYSIPVNETKPTFSTSISRVVSGAYAVEQKSGVVSLNLKPYIDSVNAKISAIRFNSVNIPQGAKVLNAYLKFYNFTSNFENFNCVKITSENTTNALPLSNTAFSVSSKTSTTRYSIWNPFSVNSADTIFTPKVDYLIDEIVSKTSWVKGNAMTFLFRYYTTPKPGSTYAVNPYMTFDAYLSAKSKGAELIIEYVDSSLTTISPVEIQGQNIYAFVRKDINKLFVKNENSFNGEITLINSLGYTIKCWNVSGNNELLQFDISGLKSGMYVLTVNERNRSLVAKVIL